MVIVIIVLLVLWFSHKVFLAVTGIVLVKQVSISLPIFEIGFTQERNILLIRLFPITLYYVTPRYLSKILSVATLAMYYSALLSESTGDDVFILSYKDVLSSIEQDSNPIDGEKIAEIIAKNITKYTR